jgi:hypothetical protein
VSPRPRARRRALIGATVLLLLAGCASGIPAWMDNPPVESGYRYSSGRSSSYSRSGARQAALANAVRELAFQKGVSVDAQIDVEEHNGVLNATVRSRQGTSTSISGMEIVSYYQVPDSEPEAAPFDYCVLIRIREADLFR